MVHIEPEFVSAGCNRHVEAADWLQNGTIVYGSYKSIVVYDPNDASIVPVTLHGHNGAVNVVKEIPLSADWTKTCKADGESCVVSQAFVSGSQDGTARLWSLCQHGWHTVRVFEHGSPVVCLAALDRGVTSSYLCLGGSGGTITFWSLRDHDKPNPLQRLDLKQCLPLSLAITELCGTSAILVVLATTNTTVRLMVWKNSLLQTVCDLVGHEDWVRSLSVVTTHEPDQSRTSQQITLLASASHDRYIRIWKIAAISDQSDHSEYVIGDDGDISESLDSSYDLSANSRLFTIDERSSPKASYVVTFEALLIGHDDKVFSVRWHPGLQRANSADSSTLRLLSASADKSMIVWAPERASTNLVIGDDQRSTSFYQQRLWIPEARLGEIGGTNLGFYGALWSPCGSSIAAHGHRGSWHRWVRQSSEKAWRPIPSPGGHFKSVQDLDWEPAGQFLATTSLDQTTRIWSRGVGERKMACWSEVSRPQIHGYNIQAVAVMDQSTLLSGADEKVFRIFTMPDIVYNSLQEIGVRLHNKAKETIQAATLPALGLSNRAVNGAYGQNSLGSDSADALVEPPNAEDSINLPLLEEDLIRMTLWPEIEKLYGHGDEILALASSPDGKWIASSCRAHTAEHAVVRMHRRRDWLEASQALSGHSLSVTRCLFSRDSRWLLTVSRDRYWCLYRASYNDEVPYTFICKARAHARIIWDASFTQDGRLFATASRDKTVRLWHIQDCPREEDIRVVALSSLEFSSSVTAIDLQVIQANGSEQSPATDTMVLLAGLESGIIELHQSRDEGQTWERLATLDDHRRHVDSVQRIKFCPVRASVLGQEQRNLSELLYASCGADCSVRINRIAL